MCFPVPWGGLSVGRATSWGPCSSPEPPELGWGEPGAQVGMFSSSRGKFSPNQSPGVTSQQEPDRSPWQREEQDGDPVSPREEQEGEWMSLWEE